MEIKTVKAKFLYCSENFGEYAVLIVVKYLQHRQFCAIQRLPFCVYFLVL